MTRIGTNCFVTVESAIKYYSNQEDDPINTVRSKMAQCDILIGKPILRPGERLVLLDNGTRYGIESD